MYSSNKLDFDFDPALLEVSFQICFALKLPIPYTNLLRQILNGSVFLEFVSKESSTTCFFGCD